MQVQPRLDLIAVVDRPVQLMMMSVGIPRRQRLGFDVDEVTFKLQLMVRVALQTVGQTRRKRAFPTEILRAVERERVAQLLRDLVVVIAELTLPVGAIRGAEDIRELIEDFIRGYRQLTVQLQLVIVGVVHAADAIIAIALQASAAIGSEGMLGVGLALRRDTIYHVHTACANDMLAHVQRSVVLAALDGGVTFLQLLQPLGEQTVAADVTALTRHAYMIVAQAVLLPLHRAAVIVNRHRVGEHIRRIERIARHHAAVHAKTVQVVFVPAVGVAVDGEHKPFRRAPLARRLRHIGREVAVVIEVVLQLTPLVPLAKPLRGHGVATEVLGCAGRQGP